MENILFFAVWWGTSLLWKWVLDPKENVELGSLQETAWLIAVAYPLFFLTAMPLVWMNCWSVAAHAGILVLSATFTLPVFLKRKLPKLGIVKIDPARLALFAGALILGIALQWKSIYYLYATHDPSAYLNAAHRIARTGKFFHENEIVAKAFGENNEKLKPLLAVDEKVVNEPWLLNRNFGTIPSDNTKGISSYHGLFGANLFLALSIKTFGSENAIRIHWLHLFASLVLLVAILQTLLGAASFWAWLAPYLFVVTPLIPTIFREPLSEPVAQVLFLVMLFGMFAREAAPNLARRSLVGAVAASLCVRISGLMYLPFLVLGFLLEKRSVERKSHNYIYGLTSVFFLSVTLALMAKVSPHYTREILSHYGSAVLRLFSLAPVWMALSGLVIAAFFLRGSLKKIANWALSPAGWRILMITYLSLFGVGLLIRYVRLFTKLQYNYGGFPFIVFNLETLFFYVGPVVSILGLGFLFKLSLKWDLRRYFFIQTFLPFCLFFYVLFRFMAMTVQLNFQRYLIIELLPLAFIGVFVAFHHLTLNKRAALARVLFITSLVWSWGVTSMVNHSNYAEGAHEVYSYFVDRLETLRREGKKPVVVAVAPTWQSTSFLMPLTNGFGDYPVVFAQNGFSFAESQGIEELKRLGYTPVMVTSHSRKMGGKPWGEIEHCYKYSQFDLAAPPTELQERCLHLSLEIPPLAPRFVLLSSETPVTWSYGQTAKHWLGFEIDGESFCEKYSPEKAQLHVTMNFNPATEYQTPRSLWNGKPKGFVTEWSLPALKHQQTHIVKFLLPLNEVNCQAKSHWDLNFTGQSAFIPEVYLSYEGSKIPLEQKRAPANQTGNQTI